MAEVREAAELLRTLLHRRALVELAERREDVRRRRAQRTRRRAVRGATARGTAEGRACGVSGERHRWNGATLRAPPLGNGHGVRLGCVRPAARCGLLFFTVGAASSPVWKVVKSGGGERPKWEGGV